MQRKRRCPDAPSRDVGALRAASVTPGASGRVVALRPNAGFSIHDAPDVGTALPDAGVLDSEEQALAMEVPRPPRSSMFDPSLNNDQMPFVGALARSESPRETLC